MNQISGRGPDAMDLEQPAINIIRLLSVDAIQTKDSEHPVA
jgi:transketolase